MFRSSMIPRIYNCSCGKPSPSGRFCSEECRAFYKPNATLGNYKPPDLDPRDPRLHDP